MRNLSVALLSWVVGILLLCAGCSDDGHSAVFTRYPDFWFDGMGGSSIAVAPFGNVSEAFDAEREIRYEIVREIADNNVYHVVDVVGGVSNDINMFIDDMRVAGNADYVLYGVLEEYYVDYVDNVVEYVEDVYDEYGDLIHSSGEVETTTTFDGYIRMSIRLYDIDGRLIYSKPFEESDYFEGFNMSDYDVNVEIDDMNDYLITWLVSDITYAMIPYGVTILYDHGDFIRASKAFRDGHWRQGKEFGIDDTLYASISLPYEANFNSFTVEVVPHGASTVLASRSFRWNSAYHNFNIEFPVSEFYMDGVESYDVRLMQDTKRLDYGTFKVK